MSTTVSPTGVTTEELTFEESQRFFEAKALELLGITGAEFLRRWEAGEYLQIADDPEHSDVMYLAILGNAQ
jgi:hypothetical protein